MLDDEERRRQIKAILIELLNAAFTETQLDQFCVTQFPGAYSEFQKGGSKLERIFLLVNTCALERGQIDALMQAIRREEPRQYDRFARRLRPLLPFPEPPQEQPAPAQRPADGSIRISLMLSEEQGNRPEAGSHVYAWLRVDDEDFDILSPDVQPVVWGDRGAEELHFELRSRRIGFQEIRVELYHKSTYLGAVEPSIEVRPAGEQPAPYPVNAVVKLHPGLPHPDLLIRFYRADVRDGEILYTYRASSPLPELSLVLKHTGSIRLNDPARVMEPVLAEMDEWAKRATPPALAEIEGRLARLGASLYQDLVPVELDELYWRLPRSCRSVQIISDVPAIPWEMLCPKGPGGRIDPALARQFALTRWHPEAEAAPACIRLEKMRLLVGRPPVPLKGAEPEAAALQELLGDQVDRLDAPQGIWQVMDDGDFDALHIISHGYAESENADESYIVLGGGPRLRASDIASYNWTERSPLLFVNACYVGREGVGLTGLGGWTVSALKGARAGAFVGAMWQATDGTAGEFARVFYEQLLQGATAGEAAQAARLAIASRPDPTWLSYAVYAHPNARLEKSRQSLVE